MRISSLLSLLLLALAACGGDEFSSDGSGGSGSGGSAPVGTCADVCETRLQLACAGETAPGCKAECTYWKEFVRWCAEPGDSYLTCLSAEPADSFGCAEVMGPLHIRPGVCPAEYEAILDCWYEGPTEGGIPSTVHDACQTICSNSAALPCANPNCVDECLTQLETTKSCDGSWAAYIDCAATQPKESWVCGAFGPEVGSACGEYALVHVGCATQ